MILLNSDKKNTTPIGVFDSGFGGLTVLKEIMKRTPNENIIFVGDSARCPYGTRDLDEVKGFALQICEYLVDRGCKMIVIACNTATAAGLSAAQREFNIPIIGVVEPGARAAVHMTRSRNVGVIATEGTISSGVYEKAIKNFDAGIQVKSLATPKFVEMAEAGLARSRASEGMDVWGPYRSIANDYLKSFKNRQIDTLVMGCTHFPIIQDLISDVVGDEIRLVSSAEETARDVAEILERRRQLAAGNPDPIREFFTTGDNTDDFAQFGSMVLEEKIDNVTKLTF